MIEIDIRQDQVFTGVYYVELNDKHNKKMVNIFDGSYVECMAIINFLSNFTPKLLQDLLASREGINYG